MPSTYEISAYPKELVLRDGSTVTVRPLQLADEQLLLEFFLGIPEQERYFLKDEVTSPALIAQWTQNLDFARALPIVALAEGRVVAEGVLIRRRGNARSHLGEVRVVVAPDYRQRGLGTLLIRDLCDIADDAALDRVIFEAVAGEQADAIEAAERMGFIRSGTIEGGARDYDGRLHDLILLAMPLGKWYQWTKF